MDTNKIKKGLGRGLSSLIGETKAEININKVSISDLVSNKFQPRKIFDEESLFRLSYIVKRIPLIFNSGFKLTYSHGFSFISLTCGSIADWIFCSRGLNTTNENNRTNKS